MATGAQTWSTNAASNNSADGSVNWAEGMAPSAVNNSARAEMASAAMWIKDNNGSLLTTGTTVAYTVTSMQVSTAVKDGYTIAVNFHATNDSSATLTVDSIGAKQLQTISDTNVVGGEFQGGTIHRFRYTSTSTAWVEISGTNVSSNTIANSAVTYAKIQNESAGTILGNGSTAAAAPAEITVGTGLTLSATSLTAPAFPPTAAYKNLSIKTASTTTIDCKCDYVTLATSGSSSFITIPCSGTINMASTGVVNGLDTGALTGANTFYAIYAIAASATSTSGGWLASTSFTTPLMPSGYTYKARLGAQITTTTTGTAALHGVYQFGRRAQYIVGVGGTTVIRKIASGAGGTFDSVNPILASASCTAHIPQTASAAYLLGSATFGGGTAGSLLVAPSTSWGGTGMGPGGGLGMVWPLFINAVTSSWNGSCSINFEGLQTIGWAGSNTGSAVSILGWDDNI